MNPEGKQKKRKSAAASSMVNLALAKRGEGKQTAPVGCELH